MELKRLALFGSVGILVLGLTARPGFADDSGPTVDKSGFNLLNPTPPDAMRAFSPERPTKILNPFTVDAGHFQIESDFLNYVYSNDSGLGTQYFQTADPTIKLGLTNWLDFEYVLNAYQNTTTRNNQTGQIVSSARGFGDTVLKFKANLIGNDGGVFAAALVPYIKLPTAAPGLGNGVAEGGVALPVQINLPGDFALGLQTEVDSLKRADDTRHYANFVNIANLSHSLPFISKDLTASVEFYSSVANVANTPAIYTFDLGLAYLLLANVQLDAGANFGLNKASPNVDLYAGVTARF
jgi:hypothetical protein